MKMIKAHWYKECTVSLMVLGVELITYLGNVYLKFTGCVDGSTCKHPHTQSAVVITTVMLTLQCYKYSTTCEYDLITYIL